MTDARIPEGAVEAAERELVKQFGAIAFVDHGNAKAVLTALLDAGFTIEGPKPCQHLASWLISPRGELVCGACGIKYPPTEDAPQPPGEAE